MTTKNELIAAIAEYNGMPKSQIGQVLDAAGIVIGRQLSKGEVVALPGLGKLKPVDRKARTARNPRTGETVHLAAHRSVKFAPSRELKGSFA